MPLTPSSMNSGKYLGTLPEVFREYSLGELIMPVARVHSAFVEFWGLPPLIPLLQYVNRLGFEICSVDSCQTEQGSLVTLI